MSVINDFNEEFVKLTIANTNENYTKETALQICEKVLRCEILELWTKKCLRFYGVDFTIKDWLRLTKCLKDTFHQMILSVSPENNSIIMEIGTWMSNTLEFVKCSQSSIIEHKSYSICIVLNFALNTVNEFLKFYGKMNMDSELHKSIEDAIALHQLVLKTLNENMDQNNFNVTNESEFSSLTEVILMLSEISDLSLTMGIKSVLETWRCIVKLIIYSSKLAHFKRQAEPKLLWVERPYKYLLREITKNVTIVYKEKEDTLRHSIVKVQKYLSVTNFYLKLLQRITSNFEHVKFPLLEDLFKTICICKSIPKHLKDTDIADILNVYVNKILDEILLLVYKHPVFSNLFVSYIEEQNADVSFQVIYAYLHAIVLATESQYVDDNTDVFIKTFQVLMKGSAYFLDSHHFNDIIEHYAALTILCTTIKMKKYFVENVLKADDFPTSYASTDVLIMVVQCIPQSDFMNDFSFWRRCNESLTLFSNNSKNFYNVQRILIYCFRMNGELRSDTIANNPLLTKHANSNFAFRNFFNKSMSKCFENVNLSNQVTQILSKMDEGACSIDDFYILIACIEFISVNNSIPSRDKLLEKVFKLLTRLNKSNKNLIKSKSGFSLLLNAFFKFAADIYPELCVNTRRKHIAFIGELDCPTTIPLLNYLNECSKEEEIPSVSKFAKNFLVSNIKSTKLYEIIQIIVLKKQPLHKYHSKEEINVDFYKRLCLNYRNAHICNVSKHQLKLSPPSKRLRLEQNEDDYSRFASELKHIYEKSSEFCSLPSHHLEEDDISTINGIVSNFKRILDAK